MPEQLASTMTPCELATQAARAIRALNELTHGGGELTSPDDVREIVASLELVGQGLPQLCEQLARFLVLPQLCEQLARFLVVKHEDGELAHGSGLDPDICVTEVIEALAAAGQAADMMAAALSEARGASADLVAPR